MSVDALAARVAEALNIATGENGYSFRDCSPEDIAGDLATYCADLEDYTPDELLPGVKLWLAS